MEGLPKSKDLIKYLKNDEPYLVTSSKLKRIVKKILKLKNSPAVIVIYRVVFTLAVIHVNSIAGAQLDILNFLNVQITNKIETFVLGVAGVNLSVLIGWILINVFKTNLFVYFLFPLFIFMKAKFTSIDKCSQFFAELPTAKAPKERVLRYINEPSPKADILIVTDNQDQQLYIKLLDKPIDCEMVEVVGEQFIFADSSKQELIVDKTAFQETCYATKNNYIPLQKRTKTLVDLKIGDTTERIEEANRLLPLISQKKKLAERLKLREKE